MVFGERRLFLFTYRLHGIEDSGSISFHENYGFWVSIQYCQLLEAVGKVSSIFYQPLMVYSMLRYYRKLININDWPTICSFRGHFIECYQSDALESQECF